MLAPTEERILSLRIRPRPEAGFFESQNVTIEDRWGISARPEALRAFDAAPARGR